jgi:hypothetical protein
LRSGLALTGFGLLSGCLPPHRPWSAAKVARIGYVRAATPPPTDLEGFEQGLREQGFSEGTDLVVEYLATRDLQAKRLSGQHRQECSDQL